MNDGEQDWYGFDGGATIGRPGSEGGQTLIDEEHGDGMRITLERGGSTAPYAITCGVYGAMVHTRFFTSEAEARADYEAMKPALVALAIDPDPDYRAFVERFP